MAIRDFYSDVDLKANQLFNSRLHNITTAARVALGLGLTTNDKGYMVYDTNLSSPYFWDGVQWNVAGGGSQNLQQVTNIGNTTTNSIESYNTSGKIVLDNTGIYSPFPNISIFDIVHNTSATFQTGLISLQDVGNPLLTASYYTNQIAITNTSGSFVLSYPSQSGTFALISDLSPYLTSATAASTYVPLTRSLTINGTTYDLSANRTWTINSLPSQATHTGQWLTTDGTNASWASLPIPTLQQVVTAGDTTTDKTITLTATGSSTFVRLYDNQVMVWDTGVGNSQGFLETTGLTINNVGVGSFFSISTNTADPIMSVNSQAFTFPTTASGKFAISVNGVTPNAAGNITIPVGTGTVTSVAALTLGTSGTDLNSTVANGTTTPVITLNVPDASATARGVINITAQTIAGQKTFNSDLKVNSYQAMTVGRGPAAFSYNIAIGYQALNVTTGNGNMALGDQALLVNTSGTDNTAIGQFAMSYNTTGTFNTAVGSGAGQGINTGSRNTAIGWAAMYDSNPKDGVGNTAMGWYAGRKLAGQYNTGIGYQVFGAGAGITTITGTYNTAIGTNAGTGITTGNYNTVVGAQTAIGNVSNNVILADGQGNVRFKDDGTNTILSRLAGTGTRMVVANATGTLSTQAIPTVPSVGFEQNFLLMGA